MNPSQPPLQKVRHGSRIPVTGEAAPLTFSATRVATVGARAAMQSAASEGMV